MRIPVWMTALSVVFLLPAQTPRTKHFSTPVRFEPNIGQAAPGAQYIGRAEAYQFALTGAGLSIALANHPHSSILAMHLAGTKEVPMVRVSERMNCISNYYLGDDSKKWYPSVPNYAKVTFEAVYPGIDLVYYGKQGRLEYDFVLQPGADPDQIRLSYSGADSMRVDPDGDLVFKVHGRELRQQKPLVYQELAGQELAGKRVEVSGGYRIDAESGEVRFALADYDRSKTLIVDPTLVYSTYLGGSGDEQGKSIAVDANGATYITGYTMSADFPVLNPAQSTLGGGQDVFVMKFNAAGTLVYSTYLGGTGNDQAGGITADTSGAAYLTGTTYSTNFPLLNAAQTAAGASYSAFVTKLSPTGALAYSTYLGSNSTSGNGIAVDSTGAAVVTGTTIAIQALNAIQPTSAGGPDAFLTKLSPSGTLVFSTYFGGTSDDHGNGVGVDSTGSIYVAGNTQSIDFPVLNAMQPVYGGGGDFVSFGDAFVAKFSSAGALVYSTYFGGAAADGAFGIAVSPAGEVAIAGTTCYGTLHGCSIPVPLLNAFQPTGGTYGEAFIAKLSAAGSLLYSTLLGASFTDHANAVAMDPTGAVYVGGSTISSTFPTLNAVQPTYGGGTFTGGDAFIVKVSPSGALVYSTFLGGSADEGATGIAADQTGAAWVAGWTLSTNFPVVNAYKPVNPGGFDAFASKISPSAPIATARITSISPNTAAPASASLPVTIAGTGFQTGAVVSWNGTTLTATATSATSLTVTVPASLLTTPAVGLITVTNPSETPSNAVAFIVPAALTLNPVTNGTLAANPTSVNGQYAPGTVVVLTATPSAGYQLTSFTGDLSATTSPQRIVMTRSYTVGATFTIGSYTLTLQPGAGGQLTANPPPVNGQYTGGTVVTVTATPNAGYQLSGFGGDLSGATNPQTITMNASHTASATFVRVPNSLLLLPGAGGTLSANPLPPQNGQYAPGTVVTVTASPNAGYDFGGFTGDLTGTGNPQTIVMYSPHTVGAIFTLRPNSLKLNAGPGGVLTANPPPVNGLYALGTSVSVLATPNPGYALAGFAGDLSGTTNPQSIVMNMQHTVSATFVAIPNALTLNASAGGRLTANPPPTNGLYAPGTLVTVTATPDSGYIFAGFTGDLSGTTNSQNITMNVPHTVAATFTQNPITLLLNPGTGGTLAANPPSSTGQYTSGAVVAITATPSAGYSFGGFTGDLSGSTNPQNITMSAAHSIGAVWNPILTANPASLNFGLRAGIPTPPQLVMVNVPAGVPWTATPTGMIYVNPASGIGPGYMIVSVVAGPSTTVTVVAPGAAPLSIPIQINNPAMGLSGNPSNTFGFIDQPGSAQTSGFSGAIPVTGWALDDLGVAAISVYREPVTQDTPASINPVLGKPLVYIGDAIFLPNTRPDVANAYPNSPQNNRAGWGMLFLTNTTLNNDGTSGSGGNGTYILHIVSTSVEGYQYELGTRTITVNNRNSRLPFGTIDTPGQGGQNITGAQYVNFGWALTNQPNIIPTDGSTMFVVIDGVKVGVPAYGFPRTDIDTLFPGYQNTGKAVGYLNIDMTKLTNGIHSIAWSVKDNANNLQGIGSRVFYVNNPGGPITQPTVTKKALSLHKSSKPAYRTGPDLEAPLKPWQNEPILLSPGERLELHTGRELVTDPSLPICSTVEGATFFWQPPIMALGDFPVTLKTSDGEAIELRIRIALPNIVSSGVPAGTNPLGGDR